MRDVVQLRDVFTPGGLPSVTYVSRDNLELESKLLEELARGFAFTVVTGPTKSGKTVLCRRVLEQKPLVLVEGGKIRSEADFWNYIAYELQIASGISKTQSSGSSSYAH
jgi:archaellum biogenesis ATPase FlaH